MSHALVPLLLLLSALALGEALGMVLLAAALPLTVAGALGRPFLSSPGSQHSPTGLGNCRALTAAPNRLLLRQQQQDAGDCGNGSRVRLL